MELREINTKIHQIRQGRIFRTPLVAFFEYINAWRGRGDSRGRGFRGLVYSGFCKVDKGAAYGAPLLDSAWRAQTPHATGTLYHTPRLFSY